MFVQTFADCLLFLQQWKIPSLLGMAARELYVGHSSKYASYVGHLLNNQRRSWLTNLNFKTRKLHECQRCQSVFFCYSVACMHFMTLPIWAVYIFKYPLSLLITQELLIEGKDNHSSLQKYLQMRNTTYSCIWELGGRNFITLYLTFIV